MVVWAVFRVHAECSIHMSQVMMVVQLRESFIRQFSLAMETLEQMVTLGQKNQRERSVKGQLIM